MGCSRQKTSCDSAVVLAAALSDPPPPPSPGVSCSAVNLLNSRIFGGAG